MIRVKFLILPDNLTVLSHTTKMEFVQRIGMPLQNGETPFETWLRIVHQENKLSPYGETITFPDDTLSNGMEREVYLHPDIKDEIQSNKKLKSFFYALGSGSHIPCNI